MEPEQQNLLPKLLVEKYLLGMHIQLWGFKDNFEYLMVYADCCGEHIRERFPLVVTETLKETLERAVVVCTAAFLQLATMEINQIKEINGNNYFLN